jgi:adenine-specific DNA methylase
MAGMKCAFCGKEIDEAIGQFDRCGRCSGGCKMVHCPHCGYANPLVPSYLKRFIKSAEDGKE